MPIMMMIVVADVPLCPLFLGVSAVILVSSVPKLIVSLPLVSAVPLCTLFVGVSAVFLVSSVPKLVVGIPKLVQRCPKIGFEVSPPCLLFTAGVRSVWRSGRCLHFRLTHIRQTCTFTQTLSHLPISAKFAKFAKSRKSIVANILR